MKIFREGFVGKTLSLDRHLRPGRLNAGVNSSISGLNTVLCHAKDAHRRTVCQWNRFPRNAKIRRFQLGPADKTFKLLAEGWTLVVWAVFGRIGTD